MKAGLPPFRLFGRPSLRIVRLSLIALCLLLGTNKEFKQASPSLAQDLPFITAGLILKPSLREGWNGNPFTDTSTSLSVRKRLK